MLIRNDSLLIRAKNVFQMMKYTYPRRESLRIKTYGILNYFFVFRGKFPGKVSKFQGICLVLHLFASEQRWSKLYQN